tara:strand:- start:3969 stop:4613 length:645 start_codon:yes stop_codon:yes gene_type:complete
MDLSEIFLLPGESIYLELQRDQTKKMQVRVIGYHQNSLVVSCPLTPDGKVILLTEGERGSIRFMAVNSMVAFNTRVVCVRMQPFPYVHLLIPEIMEKKQIRSAFRVAARIKAKLMANGKVAQGDIVNLSEKGLRIETPKLLVKEGQVVDVEYNVVFTGKMRTIHLSMEVKSIGPLAKKDQGYFYGGAITKISDVNDVLHRAFIYRKQLEQLQMI